ncbi:methyltransferase domain-containing protein [Apiospora arundinis]
MPRWKSSDPKTTTQPEQPNEDRLDTSLITLTSPRRSILDLKVGGNDSPEVEIGTTDDLHLYPDVESDDSDVENSYYAKKERTTRVDGAPSSPKLLHTFRSKFKKLQTSFHSYSEQDFGRLVIQHELSIEVHAGRLYLAPVSNPRRVLDVGTGSGEWALDFARSNPASSVLGVDLVPVKTAPSESNCSFCVGDVEGDWQFSPGNFDYIYARSLARKFSNTRQYLDSVYANLTPGGFAEFQEWITELRCPNGSLEGTAMHRWNRGMLQAFKQIGQELDFINGYPAKLADAGFVNITERRYPVPVTCWAPGKRLQRIGSLMRQNTGVILDLYSETVFVGVLGWTKEELQTLIRDVRNDLLNNNIHCYAVLMTVYCQRPMPLSSSTKSGTPAARAR